MTTTGGIRCIGWGFRQVLPADTVRGGRSGPTREYYSAEFPAGREAAHPMGHGHRPPGLGAAWWSGGPASIYWFWRDRKGLLGNPLSLLGNLITLYSLSTLALSVLYRAAVGLASVSLSPAARTWLAAALASRPFVSWSARCAARIYGWAFSARASLSAWCGPIG